MTRTTRHRTVRAAASVVGVAGAVLCGCATPGPTGFDARGPAPSVNACVTGTEDAAEQPLTSPAHASALSPAVVAAPGYFGYGGDSVTPRQAILDFPVPAGVVDAGDDVVVASYTVSTSHPGGWHLSRSLQMIGFWTEDGVHRFTRSCANQSAPMLEAMRAAGHDALPEYIGPGRTVTGWAAFTVPRTVTDITVRMQHRDPDGGGSASSPLLHIPHS